MPLRASVRELTWSNCVPEMLTAFRSNRTVKALVFMPGATDELYTFHRVRCSLPNPATLANALQELQRGGLLQASFRKPFVLVHTTGDLLEPEMAVQDEVAGQKLRRRQIGRLIFCDQDWDALQPVLKGTLKMDLRPWRGSPQSWHFYRHSFTGFDLTCWEALSACALTAKTKITVTHGHILFEPDQRPRKGVRFESDLPIRQ